MLLFVGDITRDCTMIIEYLKIMYYSKEESTIMIIMVTLEHAFLVEPSLLNTQEVPAFLQLKIE